MRTIEATGRSIDEAIFNGLNELGISIDEVDIEIKQQESKGILGIGARPAIVKLIERDPQDVVVPDYLTEEARMQRAQREREPRRDRRDGRSDRRDHGRRNDRPERDARTGRGGESYERSDRSAESDRPRYERSDAPRSDAPRTEAPRAARSERTERSDYTDRPARAERPAVEYSAEAAATDPAAIFLSGLLTHMGMQATVTANVSPAAGEEAAHTRLCVDAPSMGVLIGRRGETLDAIQYLTSLHVNRSRREQGYTRITIDTEGYRDKREETLTRLARKVASQVKATGRARTLEPMNPYERRVMHATLQGNPYVTTHSEGEEPYRRVIVEPKK